MNRYNEFRFGYRRAKHCAFINAVEQTMFEKKNLQFKGASGFPRLVQINMKYSANSAGISEQAASARRNYVRAVKRYTMRPMRRFPTVNAKIWDDVVSTFGESVAFPQKLKRKEFPIYEIASDFANCTLFIEMEKKMDK